MAQKEKFRVVADGLPMLQLPMTRRCNPDWKIFLRHMCDISFPTCFTYTIYLSRSCSSITGTLDTKSPKAKIPLRYTRDTNNKVWLAAAKKILSLFHTGEADEITRNVQVEIRNRDEMYKDYSRPLPDNRSLIDELSQVSGKVSAIVHALMQGSWSSIAYHDRVNRQAEDGKATASKPTIIVFCRPGTSCDYQTAEDEIMKILDTASHRIHLEFLPGEILLLPETAKKAKYLDPLPIKPLNGSSLGIEGNRDKAGTLGGWLFLNLPKQNPIKCAVTCYHVVRSDDKIVASHTDTQGVLLNDPRGHEMATYPAALDAQHTAAELEKNPGTSPGKARLQEVLSNPGIGNVILASGHRVHDERRLDWALIESPTTFSPNKPPPRSSFLPRTDRLPGVGSYNLNSDSKVRHFSQVKKEDWVTKRGRTLDVTSGKINKMRREVHWVEHKKVTFETEIISLTEDFAGPGDLGSIVTNAKGDLVGLLFAMADEPGRHDIGFMTSIAAIQDDVKRMTGGGFLSLD